MDASRERAQVRLMLLWISLGGKKGERSASVALAAALGKTLSAVKEKSP